MEEGKETGEKGSCLQRTKDREPFDVGADFGCLSSVVTSVRFSVGSFPFTLNCCPSERGQFVRNLSIKAWAAKGLSPGPDLHRWQHEVLDH